ncbi:MAG TPA: penicillin-binding transpeptidase domain-containing protein, partial [Pedococcus sp.]
GLSGLQAQYDSVLAGTPGLTVTASNRPDEPLLTKASTPGEDVQTTLSPRVQQAAEDALEGTKDIPSALVAVDVRSGEILAAANAPSFGFNRALTGRYPPGSTFKVATSYSLLGQGVVTPSSRVDCPKTYTVDGRVYKNYEGESLGTPDFTTDFAHSCNTAFVSLADELSSTDLRDAADALGVGPGWEKAVGVTGAFSGSIPETNGQTDQASASIGQGRNLTSPMALAAMAGAVARGSAVAPALVTEPAPEGAPGPKPIDAGVAAQLRALMRQVVVDGTATVLEGTPGGAVHGKTGTAEYGSKNPPETHAWFAGYQGDVAFAVLVERGKSGGSVAAPVAKAFLTTLAKG